MPDSSDPDVNKGGRPTDFKEEYIHQAYVVCADDGYTNAKLAKLFSVNRRTITNWLKEIPEFKEAVQAGKDEHDSREVETSLLKRAKGFQYTETTSELMFIDDPKAYQPNPMQELHGIERRKIHTYIPTKKTIKHVSPDTRACEIWLCNRRPGRWRKLKHVEVTGAGGGPIKTKKITDFPKEPETIEEWEEQVRDSEKRERQVKDAEGVTIDEKTPTP